MSSAVERLLIAAALLVCAAGAAAQDTSKPPQVPTKPAEVTKPATEPESRSVVRLSYIPGNFALPVLVGIEHGLFAREGLFLSTVPVIEEGALMRSLGQGGTDFAIGSQSLLLSAEENKLDARVVAVAGYGRELELIVPIWDTAPKTLADLKGKTLFLLSGVHNFDAVPELYRALALSKPPMRLSDVNIRFINLANIRGIMDPNFRKTYVAAKVGGILMFRDFTAAYVERKEARVVLTNEALTKLIGRVGAQPLLASKRVIDQEPKVVERFVRGWARTTQYMSDPANKEAIVRVLQIYYLRQYGYLLKKELAESYFSLVKYDRVVWADGDTEEVTINGKALGAGRNLLFAAIKDPKKRPFQAVPNVKDFVDTSFAKKAVADLEIEAKRAAEKKQGEIAAPKGPPANNGNPGTPVSEKPAPKTEDKSPGSPPATPAPPEKTPAAPAPPEKK